MPRRLTVRLRAPKHANAWPELRALEALLHAGHHAVMPPTPSDAPWRHALHDLPKGPLVVGYSGGLDSSVLLHLLAHACGPQRLSAIHVHHGLSDQADAWAEHCQSTCDALGVPLRIERVGPIEHRGLGIEAAARKARRAAFARNLEAGACLALAQHREDQVETLLIRLLRQSGSSGLAGMRRWSLLDRSGHPIWRPLLDTPRAEIRAYATRHRLSWVDDPSNLSHALLRNRLRHTVVPALVAAEPAAVDAICRSCELLATEADTIDDFAGQTLARMQSVDAHVLQLAPWPTLSAGLGAAVIRCWMDQLGLHRPTARGLQRLLEQLAKPAAEPWTIEWPGARLTRYRDLLHAERDTDRKEPTEPLAWDGRTELAWPLGGSLRLEGPVVIEARDWQVRSRRGGERIRLPGRTQPTPLKNVLQALGVPPWERARMPLVVDHEGELLAAGDLILSATMQASLNATGCQLHWRTGD